MKALEVYQLYLAIKLHYNTDNYDFFKYKGKMNAGLGSFESRRDMSFFYRLSSKYNRKNMVDLFSRAFFQNKKIWIGEIEDQENEMFEKQSWESSPEYKLLQDLKYLEDQNKYDEFALVFISMEHQNPLILTELYNRKIYIESFLYIAEHLNLYSYLDKKLNDKVVWPDLKNKLLKYRPFVKINNEELKKTFDKFYKTTYNKQNLEENK